MTHLLFGIDVSTSIASPPTSPASSPATGPVADAQRAERLGFDFVSASDHPSGQTPTYETWTMLAWMAASTTRIAVASASSACRTGRRRWSPRWPRPSTGSPVGG